MSSIQHKFIEFCIESNVLRFGEFKTKAGRLSPYFFNAGLFNTGAMLSKLADFYARTLIKAMEDGRIECDMIFGPAYKGITLAAAVALGMGQSRAVAMRMAELGYDLPFAYNRKEVKDHGEGGNTVGAPIKGHVVIIDDVISAGTSVGESVKIIEACGAHPSGVLLALDRMECAGTAEKVADRSAVEDVKERYGMPVVAIADLSDLMSFLKETKDPDLSAYQEAIFEYRRKYGTK